jgi:hypothetical protein
LGAVIPGAKIRLVNQQTLVERSLVTNAKGDFTAPFVSPGTYQVIIDAPGFATSVIGNLKIDVAAAVNLPIQLHVGNTGQTIRVDGSGISLNTTDGSVSTVIGHDFVENMPLNGRSFQDLILLTPGVVTSTPQSDGASVGEQGEFSVNGQRTESNAYSVDGVSANVGTNPGFATFPSTGGSLPASTALGTTQAIVSVDALQEFRVQSSTYSAEYGRSPGGQFNFETVTLMRTIGSTIIWVLPS